MTSIAKACSLRQQIEGIEDKIAEHSLRLLSPPADCLNLEIYVACENANITRLKEIMSGLIERLSLIEGQLLMPL